MSVLIKNMDMPNDCLDCPIAVHKCDLWKDLEAIDYYLHRHEDCPLVEVKTPHGRLIDADRLLEVLDKTQKEFEAETFGNLHIDYISEEFNDAPTVIEAEE